MILFKDAQENALVWFASGSKDLTIDQEFTVTGTIKEHKEYKGIKQTYLTRAKVK